LSRENQDNPDVESGVFLSEKHCEGILSSPIQPNASRTAGRILRHGKYCWILVRGGKKSRGRRAGMERCSSGKIRPTISRRVKRSLGQHDGWDNAWARGKICRKYVYLEIGQGKCSDEMKKSSLTSLRSKTALVRGGQKSLILSLGGSSAHTGERAYACSRKRAEKESRVRGGAPALTFLFLRIHGRWMRKNFVRPS